MLRPMNLIPATKQHPTQQILQSFILQKTTWLLIDRAKKSRVSEPWPRMKCRILFSSGNWGATVFTLLTDCKRVLRKSVSQVQTVIKPSGTTIWPVRFFPGSSSNALLPTVKMRHELDRPCSIETLQTDHGPVSLIQYGELTTGSFPVIQ